MNKGLSFEKKVASLYQQLGKKAVERDVHLKFDRVHSQFDVAYGLNKRYFVECKYRKNDGVQFSDVATFAAKLYLHNIPYKRGILVTNSFFDTRSIAYAKKRGVKLIDGKKLSRLERGSFFSRFFF